MFEVADERAIPALIAATSYKPDYDPTRELAAKAIEVLLEIGTPAAVEHVRRLCSSSDEHVRRHASELLESMDEA